MALTRSEFIHLLEVYFDYDDVFNQAMQMYDKEILRIINYLENGNNKNAKIKVELKDGRMIFIFLYTCMSLFMIPTFKDDKGKKTIYEFTKTLEIEGKIAEYCYQHQDLFEVKILADNSEVIINGIKDPDARLYFELTTENTER